ncbi:MAG: hypothetical protein IAF38_09045 [Bacteroidia bacterium]|nr:hypothetical protein [Bacteroidia bacterium]
MKKTITIATFSTLFLFAGLSFAQTTKTNIKRKPGTVKSKETATAPKVEGTTVNETKGDTTKPKSGGTRMAISNKGLPTKGHNNSTTNKTATSTGDGKSEKKTPGEGNK